MPRRFTIVRAGYGVTYNAGSYSTIARQLVEPAAVRDDQHQPRHRRRSAHVDRSVRDRDADDDDQQLRHRRSYVLGMIQTWNADLSRDFGYWNLGAGYVGTRGSDLDMLRAPNRGPDGLLLPDVQAFTWQAAEGRSILAAGNFRVRRRPVQGIGFGAHLHARPIARQHDRDRRQRDRRAGRPEPRRGVGAVELRSAASVLGRHVRSSCRSARTGRG